MLDSDPSLDLEPYEPVERPDDFDPGGAFAPDDPRDWPLATILDVEALGPLPERYFGFTDTDEAWLRNYDQGNNPWCVGESGAQSKGISEWVSEKLLRLYDGRELYMRCKQIDGSPARGTSVRVMFSILKNRGAKLKGQNKFVKIDGYVRLSGLHEAQAAIYALDSALIVTRWYANWNSRGMAGKDTLNVPDRQVAFHAYLAIGWDDNHPCPDGTKGALRVLNSFGSDWASQGKAWLPYSYLRTVGFEAWKTIDHKDIKNPPPPPPPPAKQLLFGLDVSNWQGAINWKAVAGDGITFAVAKATEGTGWVDKSFAANAKGMRAAGVIPGAYHWLLHGQAAAQARHYLKTIGGAAAAEGMLLAVDVEDTDRGQKPTIDDVLEFITELRKHVGSHPILVYTGGWFWTGHMGNPDASVLKSPLWISRYVSGDPSHYRGRYDRIDQAWWTPGLKGWKRATLLQYTSKGRVKGVAGNVDANAFIGTLAQLQALTKKTSPIQIAGEQMLYDYEPDQWVDVPRGTPFYKTAGNAQSRVGTTAVLEGKTSHPFRTFGVTPDRQWRAIAVDTRGTPETPPGEREVMYVLAKSVSNVRVIPPRQDEINALTAQVKAAQAAAAAEAKKAAAAEAARQAAERARALSDGKLVKGREWLEAARRAGEQGLNETK